MSYPETLDIADAASVEMQDQVRQAVAFLDSTFGKDYAMQNPALLGAYLQCVTARYTAERSRRAQQAGLEHVAGGLNEIAEALRKLRP